MSNLEQLLEYQKKDAELRKIEQEIASSEERKMLLQARSVMKGAESRIAAEDERAAELKKLRDDLVLRVEETARAIDEYSDLDEMVDGGGDVGFYKKNALQLQERLRAVKAELNKILAEAEALSADYKKMMEQGKAANRRYKEYSEKFKTVQSSRAAEVEAIEKELAAIAKNIPAQTLERYKQKRKENVFPVLVPLKSGMCMCGMDFSLAQQEKLQGGNVIECEHCRRFVYKA